MTTHCVETFKDDDQIDDAAKKSLRTFALRPRFFLFFRLMPIMSLLFSGSVALSSEAPLTRDCSKIPCIFEDLQLGARCNGLGKNVATWQAPRGFVATAEGDSREAAQGCSPPTEGIGPSYQEPNAEKYGSIC